MKFDWKNLAIFIVISFCFSAAVYKIDHNAIDRVAALQETANKNSKSVRALCRGDVQAVNVAHDSIRHGFKLEEQIAKDNVSGIDYATAHGLIPDSLTAYYVTVRQRQVDNARNFHELAAAVVNLKPLC